MKRSIFLIDGFNFYHSINTPQYYKYKWLDFSKLATLLIKGKETIVGIYFFTAFAYWNQDKTKRHDILIKALESVGVETVYGQFKEKDILCHICNRWFSKHVEKQTDVNIATYLFKLAAKDLYDRAYIISGDSDLVPAISAIKELYSDKEIGIVIPFGRHTHLLKNICDFKIRLRTRALDLCIFSEEIILNDGTKLVRPSSWS